MHLWASLVNLELKLTELKLTILTGFVFTKVSWLAVYSRNDFCLKGPAHSFYCHGVQKKSPMY